MRQAFERYGRYAFLLILVAIAGVIAYLRVSRQLVLGPSWDTYDYLANALEFAGKGTGYFAVYNRAPFLSFLVSIPLRFRVTSASVIFYVDAFLYVSGVAALFLLLRTRFNSLQSFFGALLYASASVVLLWMAAGLTDVAAVSVSIWAFYFLALAVDRPRFYLAAFPVATLAFLTRFPTALIVFPAAIYLALRGNPLKHAKEIGLGLILSVFVSAPYFIFSTIRFGSPFYQIGTTLGAAAGQAESSFYQPSPFYFFKYMHSYLATGSLAGIPIGTALTVAAALGLTLYVGRRLLPAKRTPLYAAAAVLAVLGMLAAKNTNIFLGLTILAGGLLLYFWTAKPGRENDTAIDALFLSWLAVFLLFQSVFPAKVERFFMPMVPGMAYLVLVAWDEMVKLVPDRYTRPRLGMNLFLGASMALLVAFSLVNSYPRYLTRQVEPDMVNVRVENTSAWLKTHQKDLGPARIYSELWPHFSWALRHDIEPPPTTESDKGFLHELLKNDAEYYLGSLDPVTGAGLYYSKIYDHPRAVPVFRRTQKPAPSKPRGLLIGKGWQNYVEQILDYDVYVFSGHSSYLDDYHASELDRYSFLFLYDFDWHNLEDAEKIVRQFAERGGTVVLDFSNNRNLSGGGTQFLDTVIVVKNIRAHPAIQVKDDQVGNRETMFSSFVGEDGGAWSGASYENRAIAKVVTADGNTLIGVQQIGKGKVYWIGYNLVWHSFIKKNVSEQALIRAIVLPTP